MLLSIVKAAIAATTDTLYPGWMKSMLLIISICLNLISCLVSHTHQILLVTVG